VISSPLRAPASPPLRASASIFAVAALVLRPALAQVSAGPSPKVSIDSLVAAGYEVRSVTELSVATQQQLRLKGPPVPELMITLQQGGALAVCVVATKDWIDWKTPL
jgi:hypothetical protein